jgi:hypothetical protein
MLYAASASSQLPKRARKSRSNRAAARVDFSGSLRSSTHASTRSPYERAVSGINCHSPTAPALDSECGLNPLSAAATQSSSAGIASARSHCSIRWRNRPASRYQPRIVRRERRSAR